MEKTYEKKVTQKITITAVLCLLLVAIADFLFYNQWSSGGVTGGFILLLCIAYIVNAGIATMTKKTTCMIALIAGQACALIEAENILSGVLIIAGFIGVAFLKTPNIRHNMWTFIRFGLCYMLRFWQCILSDISAYISAKEKQPGYTGLVWKMLGNWLLPVALSTVFIALFGVANPIVASWLAKIDLSATLEWFSLFRVLYWLMIVTVFWAILSPRLVIKKIAKKPWAQKRQVHNGWQAQQKEENRLLTRSSIIRSLCLFNAIFLCQTVMDLMYLWGGMALPEGMTYASYAHKGAYPLVATAILAALFVLISLKPGSKAERSQGIRGLVYVWVAQNIVLVISSIWRLSIYIEVYHLTLLRVSAAIWMALVAIGLTLIIVRIHNNKTNRWLTKTNGVVLAAVLYVCPFVNFSAIIAEYNVKHAKEITGKGTSLDRYYLNRLGEHALPALIHFQANAKLSEAETKELRITIENKKLDLEDSLTKKEWRRWEFRSFRTYQAIHGKGAK